MKVTSYIAMLLAAATAASAIPVPQDQSDCGSAVVARNANQQQGNQNNNQGNNAGNNKGNGQNNNKGNSQNNNQGNNQDNNKGNNQNNNQGNNQGNNNDAGNNNNAGDNSAGNNNNNAGDNNNAGGNNNAGDNNAGGNGAAADFGTCVPTINFQLGREGRKADQGTFQVDDPAILKGQQDALNPSIIMNRVCDQLNSRTCNANQAAIDQCLSAKAQTEAAGTKDASTADLFNSLVQ